MKTLTVPVQLPDDLGTVTGLLHSPSNAQFMLVLAHGAGTDMRHAFLETLAQRLADRQIATFRFNFRYKELGKGAPDRPKIALPTVRAAIETAAGLAGTMPLFAGGKSFG
ncbi:MAG: alpha/beta hydrolase, partial [Bacteroidetes bacterium]